MRWVIARLRAASPATQDTVLAAVLCVVDLLLASDLPASSTNPLDPKVPRPLLVGYAVLGYAALRWRRRAPVWVFAIMWLHSMIAVQLMVYRPMLGLLAALYTVAAYRSVGTALVALLAVYVDSGFITAEDVQAQPQDLRTRYMVGGLVTWAIVDCMVFGVGRWAGASRRHARHLEQRRQAAAREAVAAERSRIARELHDIVSHAVTVIVLQAAGAQRVLKADPTRAGQALADIEDLGTRAMGELRRLLGVLRAGEADVDPNSEIGPQPGLEDLEDLLNGIRNAGIPVQVQVEGEPRSLDRSVNLAAYRVVQEAMTNVTKHAGPQAGTTVRLGWADDLIVQITDDGRGVAEQTASTLSGGHGLLGLRERVVLVGGHLETGPISPHGFRVTARLPVAGQSTMGAGMGGPLRPAASARDGTAWQALATGGESGDADDDPRAARR
jgi:signal transduction histidine kinase